MVEDLGKMTEADLRELGLRLGPRKRVLSAIEALTEQTTAPAPARIEDMEDETVTRSGDHSSQSSFLMAPSGIVVLQNLAWIRLASRRQIAKEAGVDYYALARFLDEDRDIRLSTLEKLAEYFGMRFTRPRI